MATIDAIDAIGRTIKETGNCIAQCPENQRPGTVLFVIQTDGLENASKLYQTHQMNADQRDRYAWQFVFLGANQAAVSSAAQCGIAATSALTYGGNNAGTLAAFDELGKKTRQYREDLATAPSGAAAQWAFDESERSRAKGKS